MLREKRHFVHLSGKQFRELETFIISFQLCHNSDAAGGRMRIMEKGRRWKNYSLVELSNCGRFRGKKCFSISDGLFSVRWVMGYKHQIGCFPYVLPFFLHIYDSFKSIWGKSILMSMETGRKENMGAESFLCNRRGGASGSCQYQHNFREPREGSEI